MKPHLFSAILFAVLPIGGMAQQVSDPIVMKVAGQDVLRSELEYAFNKNSNGNLVTDPKAIAEYAEMYATYRMKVQAALDDGLDKKETFLKEYNKYRTLQLRPYLIDKSYMEAEARKVYEETKKTVGDKDILLVAHIMFSVPQKSGEDVKAAKKAQADSVYALLKGGADFGEMARKYSNDRMSAGKGGELPWLGPKSSLPEFEEVIYKMQPGELSAPFLTTAGYHIVLMKDRKQLESYEQKKTEIFSLLKENGYENKAMEKGIQKMIDDSDGTLTREQVLDNVEKKVTKDNAELRNLLKEYHDGLLLYEESDQKVWKKATQDDEGLTKFFKKNKKMYAWSAPRFKGAIIMGKSQAVVDKVAKAMENCTSKEEVEKVRKQYPPILQKQFYVRFGLYKEGDEKYVDAEMFGKAKPQPHKHFPYYKVVGKMLKNPQVYTDEKAKVIADYQNQQEQTWVKALRKKYAYSIDKSVLATVNKH